MYSKLIDLFKESYSIIILLVLIVILIDIITGFVKAKIKSEIVSRLGFIGFWKKISLLMALTFGFFLDALEKYLAYIGSEKINLKISISLPFGTLIGIYIIINESISICENLHESGVKIPRFILNGLKKTNRKLK